MVRTNRFVIMLTEQEREAVEVLAQAEKLPASTLARRLLLLEVEQRGIVVPNEENANCTGPVLADPSAVAV